MNLPVILQVPNKRLMVALGANVLAWVTTGWLHDGFRAIFYVALAVWAFSEINEGDGWFRRTLGCVVMLYLFWSLLTALHG